jgi:hypothetical protein
MSLPWHATHPQPLIHCNRYHRYHNYDLLGEGSRNVQLVRVESNKLDA